MADPPFQPLHRDDGYLPIADHGLIGDGRTAALVARDGAIVWLCAPRFDSEPVFASILDARRGGSFVVAPDEVRESRQRYDGDSGVLVTELRGPDGMLEVADALTLRAGSDLSEAAARGQLLRIARVVNGEVERAGVPRAARRRERGAARRRLARSLRQPSDPVASGLIDPAGSLSRRAAHARGRVGAPALLSWNPTGRSTLLERPEDLLANTRAAWRRWIEGFRYQGPQEPLVRRSAVPEDAPKVWDFLRGKADAGSDARQAERAPLMIARGCFCS